MKQTYVFMCRIVLALALPLLFGSIGCSFDKSESPTTPTENVSLIRTQLNGQVVDENGKAVSGATVTAYGKTTVTSKYGTFMFNAIDVPSNRAVVSVKKSGYFNAFRAEQPFAGSMTFYRIGLMSNTPQGSFSSSTGGQVSVSGSTASVTFPSNGYVKADGTPYTGTVNYVVRHLNPSSPAFFDFFSGDFRGERADGSMSEMVSYGVLRVELTSSTGEKLNIGNSKTATVKYPIAANQSASAPASMPLWYFDETKGMWKEEGIATKNGSFYEGTVSHFTDWNCDVPTNTATLTIRVKCDSLPIAGLNIKVGQRTVLTNNNGIATLLVPIGIQFTIKAHSQSNNGLESNELTVGPYNNGENPVIDLQLINCPAAIKGTLFECDNNASEFATQGVVVVKYPDGSSTIGYTDASGRFMMVVRASTTMELSGLTMNGKESSPIQITPLVSNEVRDIGKVSACTSTGVTVLDLEVGSITTNSTNPQFSTAITREGSHLIVRKLRSLEVIEIATGNVVKSITINDTQSGYDSVGYGPIEVSTDGRFVLTPMGFTKWAVYDLTSGSQLSMYDKLYIAHLSDDGTKVIGNVYDYMNTSNNAIVLYNAQTGAELSRITTIDGIKVQYVMVLTDFLANNTVGITTESRNSAKINFVDVNTGTIVNSLDGYFSNSSAVSHDGSHVVLFGYSTTLGEYQIFIYNAISNTIIGTIALLPKDRFVYQNSLAISPLNNQLALQYVQNNTVDIPGLYTMNGTLSKVLATIPNIRFNSLMYNGDGKKLVGSYVNGNKLMVRVWML